MNLLIAQVNVSLGRTVDNMHKLHQKTRMAQEALASLIVFPAFPLLTPAINEYEASVDFQAEHSRAMAHLIQASAGVDILLVSWAMDTSDALLYHLRNGAIEAQTPQPVYSFELQGKLFGVYWGKEDAMPSLPSATHCILHICRTPYTIYGSIKQVQYVHRVWETFPQSAYIAVNNIGVHKAQIYEGGSYVNGHRLAYFEETDYIYTLSEATPCAPDTSSYDEMLSVPPSLLDMLYRALVFGIRDYFQKEGCAQFVIGLSGGIDSALCLSLLAAAVGKNQVLAVLMPSVFSSDHSVTDALSLCEHTGVPHLTLPIHALYDTALESLQPIFKGTPFNVAEENLQSRLRALLLMGIANKQQRLLVNTSNKSELCMGYGTLYGDLCGGLSPLGDLYKTQVYLLAHYVNTLTSLPVIPSSILQKAPSAELRLGQKDSDTLPDYPILDSVLFDMIEKRKSVQELQALGYDRALIDFAYHRLLANQYKQKQFAPILQCSSRPLQGNILHSFASL